MKCKKCNGTGDVLIEKHTCDCPVCGGHGYAPAYRLLNENDTVRSADEFLEDDAIHWSTVDWEHSWNVGHKWHGGLKPMRRKLNHNDQ